jgi:hypothetical protein
MKKILLLLFTGFFIGCSVPKEEMEKDKVFLKSTGLRYEHILLNWNEPVEVKYLNTEKFIAVWERSAGLGSGYEVRVLFERKRVVSWKVEEIDMDKKLSKEISATN